MINYINYKTTINDTKINCLKEKATQLRKKYFLPVLKRQGSMMQISKESLKEGEKCRKQQKFRMGFVPLHGKDSLNMHYLFLRGRATVSPSLPLHVRPVTS